MAHTPALPHPARPIWWRWAHAARHLPDRLLHSWRRRRARALLADAPPPGHVLMVCHGNICRSPYAAARLQSLLASRGVVAGAASAGFIGPDRGSPGNAIAAAAARGIDLQPHRSQLLSQALVASAGLIAVMDARQADALRIVFGAIDAPVLVLGDLDPLTPETRAIRDPALQPRAIFAESYDRIDRCLDALVAAVWP